MEFFSSLVSKPDLEVIIDEVEGRKKNTFRNRKGEEVRLPTFYDRENVSGKVVINLKSAKKLEHNGLKVELIGCIENFSEKKVVSKFITLTRDLESAGIITSEVTTLPFKFTNVEKQYESYLGTGVQIRYYLSAVLETKSRSQIQETEFGVINPITDEITDTEKIKMEVGIDEWLHLVFMLEKNKFSLKESIDGSVKFKKASIKLRTMELQLLKKETILGQNPKTETNVISRYEIMDGAPTRNETIPFKWFIKAYNLTPTFPNINNKLQVQYFVNIVLIDADERKYFKQVEIILIRQEKLSELKK